MQFSIIYYQLYCRIIRLRSCIVSDNFSLTDLSRPYRKLTRAKIVQNNLEIILKFLVYKREWKRRIECITNEPDLYPA